jgi:hypothetical protein
VAAHAVGHNRQSALAGEFLIVSGLPVSILIFVIFSLAANVAHARQFDSGPYSHHTSCAAFEQAQNRLPATQIQREKSDPGGLAATVESGCCRSLANFRIIPNLRGFRYLPEGLLRNPNRGRAGMTFVTASG